jgi:hypothetical protein
VEKTDYTVDNSKLVLGNVEPEVETFDKLSSDFFARVSSDVVVRFKQRLAWRSSAMHPRGHRATYRFLSFSP